MTGVHQALEQTRDSVLRYGESVGCELLNFFDYDVVGVFIHDTYILVPPGAVAAMGVLIARSLAMLLARNRG